LYCGGWCKDDGWLKQDTIKNEAHDDPKVYHEYISCEPSEKNSAFMERMGWMKNRFKIDSESTYRSSGFTFVAPFLHQYHGVTKPLMPGIQVIFSLRRAPHKFSILVADRDNTTNNFDVEEYKAEITSIMLYVKVGHLALPLYAEIKHRHAKEPIKYFYRALQMRVG